MDLSSAFDAYYYAHDCGPPYQRDEHWHSHFGRIAECIVSRIAPKTVLDAGCAIGLLVEELRKRAVDAAGVDVSDFALEQMPPGVREHCWKASLTEPLSRRFDLITCIEVLEHMLPREADAAVVNLCAHTDDILFSSSPVDFTEPTHVNVQPPEYWAQRFADQGFYRDVDFDATFVLPWAVRFRRARDPISFIVASYERRLWHLQQVERGARESLLRQQSTLAGMEAELQDARSRLDRAAAESASVLEQLHVQIAELQRQLSDTRDQAAAQRLRELEALDKLSERDAQVAMLRELSDDLAEALHRLEDSRTLRYTRWARSIYSSLRTRTRKAENGKSE